MEAIYGVSGPGGSGTIDLIDRVDVGHLRGDHIAIRAARIVILGEIRHDGILPGVVGIGRVRRISRAAIVRALMAETERMADLVDVGLVAVAVYSGLAVVRAAVIGDPVGADVDGSRRHRARAVPAGIGKGSHRAAVIERDVRGTGSLNESNVGDLMPGLQRRLRQKLLGGG